MNGKIALPNQRFFFIGDINHNLMWQLHNKVTQLARNKELTIYVNTSGGFVPLVIGFVDYVMHTGIQEQLTIVFIGENYSSGLYLALAAKKIYLGRHTVFTFHRGQISELPNPCDIEVIEHEMKTFKALNKPGYDLFRDRFGSQALKKLQQWERAKSVKTAEQVMEGLGLGDAILDPPKRLLNLVSRNGRKVRSL